MLAPQPAPGMSQITVQVPPGATAGMVLSVQAPNGTQIQVQIPQGAGPGSTFMVSVPGGAGGAGGGTAPPGIPLPPGAMPYRLQGQEIIDLGPPGVVTDATTKDGQRETGPDFKPGARKDQGAPAQMTTWRAPHLSGAMKQGDFDWAETKLLATRGLTASLAADPLQALFEPSDARVKLSSDVDGVLGWIKTVTGNNQTAACVTTCLCPVCALCGSACDDQKGCCVCMLPDHLTYSPALEQQLRDIAAAHAVEVHDDRVVVVREAHAIPGALKNFSTVDQYGSRFSGAGFVHASTKVEGRRTTVPIQHVECELVPIGSLGEHTIHASTCGAQCCSIPASGRVMLVVKAARGGVRVTLACVECGPNSNAAQIAKAIAEARASAAPLPLAGTPLADAFEEWFCARAAEAGSMTGAAAVPPNATGVINTQPHFQTVELAPGVLQHKNDM